jgi:hypothetical protein
VSRDDRDEVNLPTAFIFLVLAEFSLKLPDREFFLCLFHSFLPFRLVAFGLLRSTVCGGEICGQSFEMLILVETNTVGVFWSFQPLPDALPVAEDEREIGIGSVIRSGMMMENPEL